MYYDLCLNYDFTFQNLEKFQVISELITSAICDGFRILALNINKKGLLNNNDIAKDLTFDIKSIFNSYSIKFLNSSSENFNFFDFENIKILKRATIEINDTKELYQFSNPSISLKSYDILAISPKNEKMFELACNDINVDIISINFDEKMNFFLKKTLIQSAVSKNVFFEIVYNGFILDNSKRAIFISNVLMLLEITKGKNLIISSGADNFIDHRSPYDIITIFQTIFNVDKDIVSRMLCENSEKVVLKSIQRKFYKTVMNIEMGEEVKLMNNCKEEKQIPIKIKTEEIKINKNKEKEEQPKEKKLMIFD